MRDKCIKISKNNNYFSYIPSFQLFLTKRPELPEQANPNKKNIILQKKKSKAFVCLGFFIKSLGSFLFILGVYIIRVVMYIFIINRISIIIIFLMSMSVIISININNTAIVPSRHNSRRRLLI